MQFLVLSERDTDTFDAAAFDAVIPAETEHVRSLYAVGVIRQIWLRGDTLGACFMIESDSLDQARAVVAELPMAQRHMSEFTVIPLSPYRGFGPLTGP